MSFNLNELIRPNILKLQPYRSARDDFHEGILLDANENGFGDPLNSEFELNRYPDPHHKVLKQKIASYKGVKTEQIFLGNGSDEAIDLLFRIFCSPSKHNAIYTPPTYGMYKVSAAIHDTELRAAPLTPDFALDTKTILEQTDQNTRLLFLCSPNNPTANDLDQEQIAELIQNFPGIVVVDEAYIDFADRSSWIHHIDTHPNLIVLQTLSKAFGLAGLRLGMAFANQALITWLMRVKAPYNLSTLSLNTAAKALDQADKVHLTIQKIKEERSKLIEFLEACPQVEKVWPTQANFILFKIANALDIYQKLSQQKVILRYRGNELHCENTLRLSVGNPEENQLFIQAFSTLLRDL